MGRGNLIYYGRRHLGQVLDGTVCRYFLEMLGHRLSLSVNPLMVLTLALQVTVAM